MKQLHAIVCGRVQMVGFRYFVVQEAQRLGLAGWVRNGDDGVTVEVIAEGAGEALRELEHALRSGPPGARVDAANVTWSDTVEGLESFRVR